MLCNAGTPATPLPDLFCNPGEMSSHLVPGRPSWSKISSPNWVCTYLLDCQCQTLGVWGSLWRFCYCVAALCLGELVVNPHQQVLEPFNWVMDWEGMLSVSTMVGLLDKNFFPKWLQVSPNVFLNQSKEYKTFCIHTVYVEEIYQLGPNLTGVMHPYSLYVLCRNLLKTEMTYYTLSTRLSCVRIL